MQHAIQILTRRYVGENPFPQSLPVHPPVRGDHTVTKLPPYGLDGCPAWRLQGMNHVIRIQDLNAQPLKTRGKHTFATSDSACYRD